MNKLIKILGVLALCLTAQVGIASAPAARTADREIISSEELMRVLKCGFRDYYDKYSHSLEIMNDIVKDKNTKYNEYIYSLSDMVEDICARELINRITDEEGNTPLILAAKYNCPIMIKYLIEKRGVTNFDAKNIYGRTAYDYMRTPSDRIGSAELDDENSVKVEGDQIVQLKHKPVIHGYKMVAEYLKSKRLKYKFDQAAARGPRLTALSAQDAKSAAQRAKHRADKKQNNDKALQEIRKKTRAAIAERTEGERMQAVGVSSTTPAQQVEEATRLALAQTQKAQEDVQKREQKSIKQENNYEFKSQMEQIKTERAKKLLQAWKWAALESKRKKEVADTKENLEAYEKEWLERDQQRKAIVEMGWAYTMREVHDNPYWFFSDNQVDSQKASKLRDEFVQKEGLREKMLLHWWSAHDEANCAVCKRYKQAQVTAANPKLLQRRKSF